MPIEQWSSGLPGGVQPALPSPAPAPIGHAGLDWLRQQPYYPTIAYRTVHGQGPGTILGGPDWDTLKAELDPTYWTATRPVRGSASPILADLGGKPGDKVGTFNLNMIDWYGNLQQWTGPAIGRQESALQQLPGGNDFLMGAMTWQADAPVRMMDHALAPVSLFMSHVLGVPMPTVQPGGTDQGYPFQKDPYYWDWLRRQPSQAQIAEWAKATANHYVDPTRSQPLVDALVRTVTTDLESRVNMLSSGNERLDYEAKYMLQQELARQRYLNLYRGQESGLPGFLREVEASLVAGSAQTGAYVASFLPVWGTPFAKAVDPITPETERVWQALGPEGRGQLLNMNVPLSMATDLAISLPLFGGFGRVATLAETGRLATPLLSASTMAKLGRAYSATLHRTNILMALGVTESVGAYVLSNYTPFLSPELGRELDAQAPISGTPIGYALMNNLGFFASGTFGAWTAAKSARWVAGKTLDATATLAGLELPHMPRIGLPRPLFGTPELEFYRDGFGGSKMGDDIAAVTGAHTEVHRGAANRVFANLITHASDDSILAAAYAKMRAVTPDTPPSEVTRIEDEIASLVLTQQRRGVQAASWFAKARNEPPPWATLEDQRAYQFAKQAAREYDTSATRTLLQRYGPGYWPSIVSDARALFEQYTKAMGLEFDGAQASRRWGNSLEKWHQALRSIHEIRFERADAELREAMVGSREKVSLWSQRTLFEQDVETALPILRGTDAAAAQALARQLVESKDRVGSLYALGKFAAEGKKFDLDRLDVKSLADSLETVHDQGVLPHRRDVSANPGALNAFGRRIEAEGLWTLGFHQGRALPGHLGVGEAVAGYLRIEQVAQAMPQLVTRALETGVPAGYREVMPGDVYKVLDWQRLKPKITDDGRYVILDDPSVVPLHTSTGAHQQAALSVQRVSSNDLDQLLWDTPPFAWPASEAQLSDTGKRLSGRNAGADWPVLEDIYNGDRYLFKSLRPDWGSSQLRDIEPYRLEAAYATTRLFEWLGLKTAVERPFLWHGISGTLQPVLDVDRTVDMAHLWTEPIEAQEAAFRHHVVDWLTSQHDSNSDSLLLLADGTVAGVDKGQAFKYITKPSAHEPEAFLDPEQFWAYDYDAADRHLGEYLLDAVSNHGMTVDRAVVEDIVQRLEAIPDGVWQDFWQPLIDARRAAFGDADAARLLQALMERKHRFRDAVNGAFEAIGSYTYDPAIGISWQPLHSGTFDFADGTPEVGAPHVDMVAQHKPIPEPDLEPTADHYKAGVVILEGSGGFWSIEPAGHFQGYEGTLPKGRWDGGATETIQQAAIREAREETGFDVELVDWLVDVPNEVGNVTRYYIAQRRGGSPADALPNETATVKYAVNLQWGRALLTRNGVPDPRDTQVLDALEGYLRGQRWTPPTHQATAQPLDTHTAPGQPDAVADPSEYVWMSVARLPNGQMWKSPWLDRAAPALEQVELGNRNLMGNLFDSTFRGWHTYRLMEAQRMNLHKLVSERIKGVTSEQIEGFHRDALALARKARVPTQAVVAVRDWMPVIGHWAEDVDALAERWFGKGPYLGRDGKPHDINWHHELARAYSQSMRLNLMAGATGYIKSLPVLGSATSAYADFIYPLVRFGLSPLFKIGELWESAQLNLMHGVNPFGDPYLSLMQAAGVGHSAGNLADNLLADAMISGMSMLYTPGSATARAGASGFFYDHLDVQRYGRLLADRGLPESVRVDAAVRPDRSRLNENLWGQPFEMRPDLYPDTYSERTPGPILRPAGDPTNPQGKILYGGDTDAAIIALQRRGLESDLVDAALRGLPLGDWAQGYAFLANLPRAQVEALAEHAPLLRTEPHGFHTTLRYLQDAIDRHYRPVSGRQSHGTETTFVANPEGRALPEVYSPMISQEEQHVGFADATYASCGSIYHGGYDSIAIGIKHDMLRESWTTDADRITYGNNVDMLREHSLTPAGILATFRLRVQAMLRDYGREASGQSLLEWWQERSSAYWNSTNPELAFLDGVPWSGIEAFYVPEGERPTWETFLAGNRAAVPELDQIPTIYTTGSPERAAWQHAFEMAGLNDLAMATHEPMPVEQAMAYLPDLAVTPATADKIGRAVEAGLRNLGVTSRLSSSTHDLAATAVQAARQRVAANDGHLETILRGGGDLVAARRHLAESQLRLREAEDLLAEADALWDGVPWTDIRQARDEVSAAYRAGAESPQATLDWIARAESFVDRLNALTRSSSGYDAIRRDATIEFSGLVNGKMEQWSQTLPPRSILPTEIEASAIADEQETAIVAAELQSYRSLSPAGYAVGEQTFLTAHCSTQVFEDALLGGAGGFVDQLHAAAAAKVGHDVPAPTVRLYLRGDATDLRLSSSLGHSTPELVVSITGPDGGAYGGLSPTDIERIWRSQGPPKQTGQLAATSSLGPDALGSSGNLLWADEGGPAGRLWFYHDGSTPDGEWVNLPDGRAWYRGNAASGWGKRLDVVFSEGFRPDGKSYAALTDRGRIMRAGDVEVIPPTTYEPYRTKVTATLASGEHLFSYDIWDRQMEGKGHYYEVFLDPMALRRVETSRSWQLPTPTPPRASPDAVRDMLLDAASRVPTDMPLRLVIMDERLLPDVARRWVAGEFPDNWVLVKGWDRNQPAISMDDMRKLYGVPESVIRGVDAEGQVGDLAAIRGTPEAVTANLRGRIEAAAAEARASNRWRRTHAAFEAVLNPTPFKEHQQDLLTVKLLSQHFPIALKESAPQVARVFGEDLGVPESMWAKFLVKDRYLLDRYLASGSREDFTRLVEHADTYRRSAGTVVVEKGGTTARVEGWRTNRAELDELYANPEFDALLEAWRLSVKVAEDEAFGVHFFSVYRSTFERSINHPLFGVYPASWAFKVAKEWARFLFQNETLGIRLGMAPAVVIARTVDAQARLFAQTNPSSLEDFYEKGPYRSAIFMFNLITPGDWSSIPFPLARTTRDILRGISTGKGWDPATAITSNFDWMGLPRDVRLASEATGEAVNTVTGRQPAAWSRIYSSLRGEGLVQRPPDYSTAYSVRDYAWR